ncbi:MAG: type IV-A pilus assembly ATPase PilB, partial [Luteimonas sp.]
QTISRLMNMGVAPYNITSSVTLVIAQRLARRLHDCKREVHIPDHALLLEGFTADEVHEGFKTYEAVGCQDCTEGYKGRTGIYQVMPMSDEIQNIILEGGNAMQISQVAKNAGVKDLRQSALLKVKNGLTSLAEINRVTKD